VKPLHEAVPPHETGAAARVPHHPLLGLEARTVLGGEAQLAGDDEGLLVLFAHLPPEHRILEETVGLEGVLLLLVALIHPLLAEAGEDVVEGVLERRSVGLEDLYPGVRAELVLQQARRLGGEVDVRILEIHEEAGDQDPAKPAHVELGLQRRLDRHLDERGAPGAEHEAQQRKGDATHQRPLLLRCLRFLLSSASRKRS